MHQLPWQAFECGPGERPGEGEAAPPIPATDSPRRRLPQVPYQRELAVRLK